MTQVASVAEQLESEKQVLQQIASVELDEDAKCRAMRVHWGDDKVINLEDVEEDDDFSDFDDAVDELEDENNDFTKKLNAARFNYPQVSSFMHLTRGKFKSDISQNPLHFY